MKAKWMLLLVLAMVVSGRQPAATLAAEKEPTDLIFEQILKMYEDLEVDRLFELAGVERRFRKKVSFNPRKADYFKQINELYKFSDAEVKRLGENGFVVRDTGWAGGFGIIYYNIYARDLPVLVTTDSLLHAMHKSYDDILKELEAGYLSPGIARVLEATRQQVFTWARETTESAVKESLQDADLYLTVALSLLRNEAVPSLLDSDPTVARVLKDVESLRMLVPGQDPPVELFGEKRWIDFSQFKPRGHYTDSPQLENYFRAMMWLGRADTGMNVLQSQRQLRTAALLTLALKQARELDTLKAMDEIIAFMVGDSDNLTVFGLAGLLADLTLAKPAALADRDGMAKLQQGITDGRAGTQRIRSQTVVSWPDDTVKVAPPSLFQLFGQRYVIDSFVLSKVVYDDIIYKGAKQQRYMPAPLDVMAALGNIEAIALLEPQLRAWNYSANLKASMDFVASHRPEFWQLNLYNIWLDALRTLDEPVTGSHVPQALQTRAWQHKQLNTQLASWAELRHDTILYAKQSYTAMAGCVYPAGYVEPYPNFYRKLGFFARRAGELFEGAEFIDEYGRKRYATFFGNMERTMARLEKLADKELAGESFSKADDKWLDGLIRRRDGNGYMAEPEYSGWYVDLYYGGQDSAIEWDPEIADVHTDPNSRRVLEVGVGRVNTLFLAVDSDKDLAMFAGPTLSYHEFMQPATKRLTDPEWKAMLEDGTAPNPPAWTESFRSPAR